MTPKTVRSTRPIGLALLAASPLLGAPDIPLRNWSAPATYIPSSSALKGLHTAGDIAGPLPYIPIAPCRQYNSTGTPLLQGVNRAVTLTGAPCGILSTAKAVSVNITIFNIVGQAGNAVFKVDTVSPPTVAWINYPPGEVQRGNAGVVALDATGQIIVQVAQGAGQIDFVVDTNGYYPTSDGAHLLNTGEQFFIASDVAGDATITGINTNAAAFSSGVHGIATDTGGGGIGVWGQNLGAGRGLYGSSSSGTGVHGVSTSGYGVAGTSTITSGVIGVSTADGTVGISTNGNGVLGSSTSGSGVAGYSTSASGVYGNSSSGNGVTGTSSTGLAVQALGDYGGTGAKYFLEPHPTDAARMIRYVAIEGPEAATYFRGSARISGGQAVISVPEHFQAVTSEEGVTVQLTPVGAAASMYIQSQDLRHIVVRSSKDVTFHYLVQGVRRGYEDYTPVVESKVFAPETPDQTIPAYLNPEQKRKVIANGTYNPDGTVNMTTAVRLGWAELWAEQAAELERRRATPPKAPSARPAS